jgi:hypothetical protein
VSNNQLLSPKWANLRVAAKYSGLSIRLLQGYIAGGLIRSALVKKPGCERGVRLIDLASLDELIEASIGQRVELKMNQTKPKPPLENAPSH